MKKSRITAVLCTIAMLTSAVSCGGKTDEVKIDKPLESSDSESTSEKIEITIASRYLGEEDIGKFNRTNSKYHVTLNNYDSSDDESPDEALKRMHMDIVAGNAPDIIVTSPEYIMTYIKSGYLADLYPIMESGNSIKKDDILPNVREGLEIDGKLPAICNYFFVDTAVAKTKFVGENAESWSVDDAIDFYKNCPEEADFLWNRNYFQFGGEANPCRIDKYMVKKLIRECVDMKNGTLNISDDFRKAIHFIEETGNIESKPKIHDEAYHMFDEAVIYESSLSGFNRRMSEDIYASMGGEDITFIGYPSSNGNGAVAGLGDMFGILDNSPNKEGAWEFISQYLGLESGGKDKYSFSITTDALEKQSKDSDKYNEFSLKFPVCWGAHGGGYTSDENNNMIPLDEEFTIDDKTVQQALDYVKNAKLDFYFGSEIDSIVDEEIGEMLGGARSADECIDMIENRLNIYVNEKK